MDEDPELADIRRRLAAELMRSVPAAGARPPGSPLDVTDATFDATVAAHPAVLVDLWAPWCGPCRYVGPILAELAAERAERLVVAKVNVDENPAVSRRFQVQGIPTLLLFRTGRLVDRMTGAAPKPVLAAWLDRHGA